MPRLDARLLRGVRVRAPSGHRVVPVPPEGGEPARAGTLHVIPPRDDWRPRRQVSHALADLLAECARPVRLTRGRIGDRALAALILDGVVEAELGGRFRAGAAAHRTLFGTSAPVPCRGPLGRLSVEALRTAAACGRSSPAEIADRLYRFNTLPASATWQQQVPDDATAREFLGADDDRDGVEGRDAGPWRSWEVDGAAPVIDGAPTWKLYLSPRPAGTREACRVLREMLGRRDGPFSMKVARTAAGVGRPDRLVGYFDSRDRLRRAAVVVRAALRGMQPQGVPFTASLGSRGLLSWGADFGDPGALPALAMERSWRGWITVRLGGALDTGLRAGATDPVAFALDRVSLDGVNVNTWSPARDTPPATDAGPHADQ